MLLLAIACTQLVRAQKDQYVLVVSMDGFRWDYPEKYGLKNILRFGNEGVRASSLRPSFPSKTFPNHYTLATGLVPARHGIVMNSFHDPLTGRDYSIGNRAAVMDGTFYGGEPIWVTAETQGIKSACFYWVGSEADIHGIRPTYWKKYEHGFPYGQRIDTVIHWLSLPQAERPRLLMLYFDEPDGVGHEFGPDHPETGRVLQSMDSLFGVFLARLDALDIADSLNVILLSDHGMGAIDRERSIRLDSLLDTSWVLRVKGGNPAFNLELLDGYEDSVLQALSGIPHLKAWKNGQAPEHLDYRDNPRILDVTVVADSAWSVFWGEPSGYSAGTHGYDPYNKDMHAIFMARGPAFLKEKTFPTFGNVNVYNILAYILGLKPAANDGDPAILREMGD
jgi:alkaline phosphatase D